MSKEKEEKKALRKEMLGLMNQDNEWYRDETTDRYKRIRELAILLGVDTSKDQLSQLTPSQFEAYVAQSYTMKEIAIKVGVTDKKLLNWRITHGYPANLRGYTKK